MNDLGGPLQASADANATSTSTADAADAADAHAHAVRTPSAEAVASIRTPVLWGAAVGCLQAASPLAFWWLDAAAVYALGLIFIAAVYIGFAVADGRPRVLVVETVVATVFVLLGAAGIAGPAWLLVVGFVGHGMKDLWQHRSHYVANTRWWPPFCLVVDWVVAAILIVLIVTGAGFRH